MRIIHEKAHNSPLGDETIHVGIYDWTMEEFIEKSKESEHEISKDGKEIEFDFEGNGEWVEVWIIET